MHIFVRCSIDFPPCKIHLCHAINMQLTVLSYSNFTLFFCVYSRFAASMCVALDCDLKFKGCSEINERSPSLSPTLPIICIMFSGITSAFAFQCLLKSFQNNSPKSAFISQNDEPLFYSEQPSSQLLLIVYMYYY